MNKSFFPALALLLIWQFCFVQTTNAQSWQALSSGIGTGASDNSSIVQALYSNNGNVYAGGEFSVAGGNAANNIAVWNGTNWSAIGAGIGAGDPYAHVFALAEYNGNLYAAGIFMAAGGNTAYNIAEWDGNNWQALGTGIGTGENDSVSGTEVNALAVYNGKLYAAGIFSQAGGHAVNNIASWDGSNWSAAGPGIGGQDPLAVVSALVVYNGNLYAAGTFDTAGTVAANNIARWDGSSWAPVGSGITNHGSVTAMAVYNSSLYAGGIFDSVGNTAANNIAEWNGTSWSALGSGIGGNSTLTFVFALVAHNGFLYAGGGSSSGVNIVSYIDQWDGNSWSHLISATNNFSTVYALTADNANVYAGGSFTLFNQNTLYNIAEWGSPTGINQINKNNNVTIYPNPASGAITFSVQGGNGTQQLQIYNLTGSLIYQGSITQAKPTIDLSNAAQGPYLYRLNSATGDLISTGKFIIQ